jgi:hypothetical protein
MRINKMMESNNWSSDLSPYYPVEPCPYANPNDAPANLRFLVASGQDLGDIATSEISWMLRKGIPRAGRMISGRERFVQDPRILREGYHSAARTSQFGRNTFKTRYYTRQP